jgi:hypothetical protein
MSHRTNYLVAALLAMAACTSSDADIDTNSSGHAIYRDAETDHQGQPAAAAHPDPQDMNLTIEVSGTASLADLEPRCALDEVSGRFTALFEGQAVIDEDGVYAAGLASTEATFLTDGGCTIPPVELTAMTEVVVRAELAATVPNCETYCQAEARAAGEAECGADASAATCRGTAEASYAASCTSTCTSETQVIVAETALSATAIAELNAQTATGTGLGELEVDLVFDHME